MTSTGTVSVQLEKCQECRHLCTANYQDQYVTSGTYPLPPASDFPSAQFSATPENYRCGTVPNQPSVEVDLLASWDNREASQDRSSPDSHLSTPREHHQFSSESVMPSLQKTHDPNPYQRQGRGGHASITSETHELVFTQRRQCCDLSRRCKTRSYNSLPWAWVWAWVCAALTATLAEGKVVQGVIKTPEVSASLVLLQIWVSTFLARLFSNIRPQYPLIRLTFTQALALKSSN